MSANDFATEVAELEQLLPTKRAVAVARLRVAHERWARALLAIDPSAKLVAAVRLIAESAEESNATDAIEQLVRAEDRQWEIGTWSSGSGEGLASMFEVRKLQLAQAWLWASLGERDRARERVADVEDDPNGIGTRFAEHITALHRFLAG